MNYESRVERADTCRHGQPMEDACNLCTQAEAAATTAATASTLAGVTPERVAPNTVDPLVDLMQGDIQKQFPVPQLGAYMDPKHRYWMNGEGPVPSVTTILGIMDKPAVGVWKAKEAARAVYRETINWGEADWLSEDETIAFALKEADKARDTAAELGSSVHLLADLVGASETDATPFQTSDDTYPYVNAFRGFLDRYGRSSIVSSEHMVWSLNGYAGTYDLIMQLDNEDDPQKPELWLIDIKTSKGFYPEYGLQLAGYRWADSIVLPGNPNPYPMPQIQRTGVLHLRPDLYPDTGWRLIEYPTTYKDDYIPFLAALELYQWKGKGRFTKSKLQPPKRQNQKPSASI